jgi:hypothetical protein
MGEAKRRNATAPDSWNLGEYYDKVFEAVVNALASAGGGHPDDPNRFMVQPNVAAAALVEIVGILMGSDPGLPTHEIDRAAASCGPAIAKFASHARASGKTIDVVEKLRPRGTAEI